MLRCLIAWIYEFIKQEEKLDSLALHKEVLSTSVAREPSRFGAWTKSWGSHGAANKLFTTHGSGKCSYSHLFMKKEGWNAESFFFFPLATLLYFLTGVTSRLSKCSVAGSNRLCGNMVHLPEQLRMGHLYLRSYCGCVPLIELSTCAVLIGIDSDLLFTQVFLSFKLWRTAFSVLSGIGKMGYADNCYRKDLAL